MCKVYQRDEKATYNFHIDNIQNHACFLREFLNPWVRKGAKIYLRNITATLTQWFNNSL